MRHGRIIAIIAAVIVLAVLWGIRPHRIELNHSFPKYDVATEVTFSGVVQAVEDFRCPISGGALGTHVLLQTEAGVVRVHLGPSAFVSARRLRLVKGDRVQVVASRVGDGGERDAIAREVVRREGMYILRDANGNPLWSK